MASKPNIVIQLRELQGEFNQASVDARAGFKVLLKSNRERAKELAADAVKIGKAADKFETPSDIDDVAALFSLERMSEKFKLHAQAAANVKSLVPFSFMLPQYKAQQNEKPEVKLGRKLDNIIAQIA